MANEDDDIQPRRLRVLFVPDLLPWVTGTIARQVARCNPWIEPTILSGPTLRWYVQHTGQLPEVDVVHLLTEYEAQAFTGMFQGRVPVVHSIHHVEDWQFMEPLTRCDAIHVIADQWRDYLLSRGVPQSRMVSMTVGVDAEAFAPVSANRRQFDRRKLGIAPDSFVVGFCAKVTSNSSGRKAPEVFIEGIRRLSRQLPRTTPLIIGPGWSEVLSQLRAEGINPVWMRFVENHADLARLYRSMDVYWVTSRIEGGPVPLLEAMSCGTPCVSTRVGIAEEAIEHGVNGYIAAFDDCEAFVQHSMLLAQGDGRGNEMGRLARATITADWQWKKTCASARELYGAAQHNFAEAHGRPLSLDLARIVDAHPLAPPDTLCAIPGHLQASVRIFEDRLLVAYLKQMQEERAARRHVAGALLRNLASSQQWTLLLETLGFERTATTARRLKALVWRRPLHGSSVPTGEPAQDVPSQGL